MASYYVTLQQRWDQRVLIKNVSSRREALVSARQGEYTIEEDAKYVTDVNPLGWAVEEAEDD